MAMSSPAAALPPEPSSSPAVQTLRWLFRPIAFMGDCRRRYGDTFSIKFIGFETPLVMISDPDAIRALYTARENGLPPGRTVTLEPIMGPQSILLQEGADHLARRKLMLPPFHGERMRAYEEVVSEVIEREIESWPTGEPFPIHPRMQAVTLEVILRAVFGVVDPARLDRLRAVLGGLLGKLSSPGLQFAVLLAGRLPGFDPMAQVRRVIAEADELLFAEITDRRASGDAEERDDILSLLMSARFEDGGAMSDAELRDQLMTLLLAGHETTATALAWTIDLLLRNPATLARLSAEVEAAEGEEYLRATISEGLRLRPVIPLAGRRLHSDLSVDGYTLPAGTDVTPSIWLTHTRADIYPEPFAFRPERFLEQSPETYSWIPFGGGARRCLGAAFAEFEMRIVLRAVVGRCDLRAAEPGPQGIARRNVTFSPRKGTPVVMT
ncbi:MAG: cytochrome P450, partial [Thermoleophilaceae bacterium]|nr:cytochrome P450 [Thermoleophilaceae bacterium]